MLSIYHFVVTLYNAQVSSENINFTNKKIFISTNSPIYSFETDIYKVLHAQESSLNIMPDIDGRHNLFLFDTKNVLI